MNFSVTGCKKAFFMHSEIFISNKLLLQELKNKLCFQYPAEVYIISKLYRAECKVTT